LPKKKKNDLRWLAFLFGLKFCKKCENNFFIGIVLCHIFSCPVKKNHYISFKKQKKLKIVGQISTWILERRGAVLVLAFKTFWIRCRNLFPLNAKSPFGMLSWYDATLEIWRKKKKKPLIQRWGITWMFLNPLCVSQVPHFTSFNLGQL
jgi:hypothetical protein